jgi:hypothetical protein
MKIKNLITNLSARRNATLLWRASKMYLKAVDEAERLSREDGFRYFVIWDPSRQTLIPITYELHNAEGDFDSFRRAHPHATYRDYMCSCRGDSYKSLVWRGRFKNRLTYEEFKAASFYYTANRHKPGSNLSGEELDYRKREWMSFYLKVAPRLTFRHIQIDLSPKRFFKRVYLGVKSLIVRVIQIFY